MAAAAATLAAAAALAAQDTARAQVPPAREPSAAQEHAARAAAVPAPFAIERALAPIEFAVSFKLGEDDGSRLRVLLEEPEGSMSTGERCVLSLDFEPLEGARWTWSRSSKGVPLASALLTHVPEPKGLEYALRFRFPPCRGLEVTLPDGAPVLAATTPLADSLTVSFERAGNVLRLEAGPATAPGDSRIAAALARLPPPPDPAFDEERIDQAWDETWAAAEVGGSKDWTSVRLADGTTPPLVSQRKADEVETREGRIERVVLEVAERVEVPVLLLEPAGGGRHPSVLLVASGPRGKSHPGSLAAAGALASTGSIVAAMDFFVSGERSELQPYDSLHDLELLLVGSSACEYAARESRQVLAWLAARTGTEPETVAVVVDRAANDALAHAGSLVAQEPWSAPVEAAPSPALADASVFGEDLLRRRYDSWLLEELFERRGRLSTPDRSVPLVERIARVRGSGGAPPMGGVWWNVAAGARWQGSGADPPNAAGPIVVAVSDFGMTAALDQAARAFSPEQDVWFLALPTRPRIDQDWIAGVGPALRTSWLGSQLERVHSGIRCGRIRLFGEGAVAVALLHEAALEPERVESVTALRAIPSFETLLLRASDARRAPGSLGVLTQGMPAELFEHDALSRYELEDCVLELKSRGIPVDWREPVDALRRPLSRHDRLALWPRLRRLELRR